MAKIHSLDAALPISQVRAIPLSVPEMASTKDGYIKVRLDFLTQEPRHVHSSLLQSSYDLSGPFLENICVLIPQESCFDLLECFAPFVGELCKTGAVALSARLYAFEILEEDALTLSYVFN